MRLFYKDIIVLVNCVFKTVSCFRDTTFCRFLSVPLNFADRYQIVFAITSAGLCLIDLHPKEND